ncbi:MAG: serine/threonine protein phosphatase, partial [Dehalococcoidia bacterium]|nr:serine/threonine protein phosphatase [Dehalococcoidia bacterium]
MPVLQPTIQLQAKTDKGRRRSNNEDVALTKELSSGYTLLAVADGVGGSRAGEVASAEAAEALLEEL